ncbi:hypothetical protein JR316_0011521 [Psilocybe cubensis]|uniref:Uncharacterized protein n=2 Tax=Psilocybe cubensis TaxID=181762 RepID=A0A8H8CJF4_PSICU|nr:hypothetical protein JR316_0011521 [Psilocybe cubensis]KAH9475956.1 hypothetical protein JR316_0011521 [Psilocybe cubensis]
MQDGDHDALHLPILGDSSTGASQGETNNRLLVVATLAAIVLAGSAIVYRTRPLYSLIGPTQSDSGPKDAAQKVKEVEGSQGEEKGAERVQGASSGGGFETGTGVHNGSSSSLVPGSPARMADEFDTKESKSSRSKDRRRRGKDPLKEILKSEKKSKGLGSPTISAKDPSFAKSPAGKDPSSPSSPMSSLFSDSQLTRTDNAKNNKTRRVPQREKSNIGPDDTMSQAQGSAPGSTSVTLSRGTSESIPTSENLQKQYPNDRHDSPSSSSPSSQPLPPSDPNSHPYTTHHNRPPSSLASDDGHGRPLSSMSFSTTSSATSGHFNNVEHHDEVPEWDNNADDTYSTEKRNRTQARLSRLASKDDEADQPHRSSSFPPSTIDNSASYMPSSYATSNSNFTSHSVSSSVSASTETTNAAASTSSSLILSTGEMTPATSPTLSHDSVSLKTILASQGAVQEESDDAHANRASSSLSSHNADSIGVIPTKRMKARKKTSTANMNKGSSHNPWDWDGAGDAPSPSSSHFPEGDSIAENETGKDKETYQKPPRLQQSGASTLKGASFSAVAASRLPASSTHPTSLHSPTSSSFGQSVSGSGLPTSTTAAPGSVNRTSPSLGSESGLTLGELTERDEEEAFTFPTLNPTPPIAGPSRTRPTLSDINNNISNNTSTIYNSSSTSRRAPTPRRPPTPSHNNSTPPPHPSSSSSSSPRLGHTSLNSPTSHSASNGSSMPALSTQTQLASLRGALEAARLREEKNKQEIERYAKEMEILKWENVNWRRGEVELQAHIRHLTHQLQSYAALYASVAPQLPQQQQQPQQPNGTSGTSSPANAGSSASTSANVNGYGPTTGSNSVPATPQTSSSVLSPTPQQPQPSSTQPPPAPTPLHLQQMLSNMQMNGMSSPAAVMSPISISTPPLMNVHPGAPFFPYGMPPQHTPPHPMMIHAQQMQFLQQQQYQQQQQGTAQPSPHQANIFSSIFPPGPPPLMSPHQQHQYSAYIASQQAAASVSTANPYGSGPSSATGSSGSLSPDLTGSPTPGGMNGARRTKTRTQTAGSGMSSRAAWDDTSDGWLGVGGAEEGEDQHVMGGEQAAAGDRLEREEEEYGEVGINSILADAILKRPASIRVRSSSRRGKLDMEKGSDASQEHSASPTDKPEPEQLTEFTFPSLSNLGNVNYRSDVIAVNGGLSSSSSSVASPQVPSPHIHDDTTAVDISSNGQAADEVGAITSNSTTNDTKPLKDEAVELSLESIETTSNSESDTTPRKEAPETNSTNLEHEPCKTQETNGLSVGQ